MTDIVHLPREWQLKQLVQRYLATVPHTIEEAISRWESAGMVRVLKPFQSCGQADDCIEATRFIEKKSPIKGWLNWHESDELPAKKEEPNQPPEPTR